ncbi:MAG: nitrite/sulfite reductase [Acidimicrobiia bacterium]|nr:nitrite/sulfite reductase [Acidimicrobiia bacterium]
MTWKRALAHAVPRELAAEIETFENQIALKKQGKLDDKLFAETRLRRGVYGQRYDNGRRNDGVAEQSLPYPSGDLTKGPETLWDAPGMQRIKIPFGGLTAAQMRVLADLAEEYSDGVCHVTTRQDIQLHYVHLEDTPALAWRLAAVGITTREACGNSVRNVTACPLAGVCPDETFDVTPYARATSRFLMGHPDTQEFGRKFKVAFSGCGGHACGLVSMHDLGAIATTKQVDGVTRRGFETYVGGGLGTVPYAAQVLDEFVPEEEFLPLAQAISRVFARLGEKKQRSRARIKFLVAQLGIEEFSRLVREERARLTPDERWTAHLAGVPAETERPLAVARPLNGGPRPEGFDRWHRTNVTAQRQPGYAVATITLPLGDLTARQMRKLADLAETYVKDTVRLTVEQNIVLRWVADADLPALYSALADIGLAEPDASTIADITACPGTDTCKLGIASSRGLAAELRARLARVVQDGNEAVERLHIKISGCFNSCAQHHIADIGFYGVSRKVGRYTVPHFQVVLGGQWDQNAGAYGLAVGAVPSKRVPEVLERIVGRYVQERTGDESFRKFVERIGKRVLKESFADLATVPTFEEDPSFYSDWGDPRVYTIADMGVGECAGEVVEVGAFDLAAAEAQVFEAQIQLEEGDSVRADALAYRAMLLAARSLVKQELMSVSEEPNDVVREFRARFHDTGLFHDRFAGGKFAEYLFHRHDHPPAVTPDAARRVVEEAQLFLEATHACAARLAARPVSAVGGAVSL